MATKDDTPDDQGAAAPDGAASTVSTDSAAPPKNKSAKQKPLARKAKRAAQKPQQLPPYNVILLNDNDHSYEYVVEMLHSIFSHTRQQAYQMACEVDSSGRVIVFTTHREHAELKRDQIHAFGTDITVSSCAGSMSAVIEAAR